MEVETVSKRLAEVEARMLVDLLAGRIAEGKLTQFTKH